MSHIVVARTEFPAMVYPAIHIANTAAPKFVSLHGSLVAISAEIQCTELGKCSPSELEMLLAYMTPSHNQACNAGTQFHRS
jgi:hypothetical protein